MKVIDILSKNDNLRLVKSKNNCYNVQKKEFFFWTSFLNIDQKPFNFKDLNESQNFYKNKIKERDLKERDSE